LIPNFFEAESSLSSNNNCSKMNKTKTPLCANSSYLNATTTDRKNYSYNKSNKISNNHNGSFIEVKSAIKNQNLKNTAPALIVSNVDMDIKKSQGKICTCCGINMKTNVDEMACNLFDQYDLNSYSPNKKCAKFIEANSFSPHSPKSESLMMNNNNIHSSAKKSLLAKAISNNALTNDKVNNLSMEDLSIMSSNSSLSSCSSITSLTGSPSSTAPNKVTKTKSLSNVNISELDNENEDSILKKSILCDECWTKNKATKKADTSYVSLIAIDNEDDNENKANFKRKVRLSTENDMINYNNEHRRSSIMSDSNSEKNKKFKNQVTSTPAAQQFLSNKKGSTSRKSNSFYQHNNINNNDGKFIFCFKHNNNNITIFDLGLYFGNGRHIDGSSIRIFYQRKLIMLNEAESSDQNEKMNIDCDQPIRNLICVWISRDPYSDKSILDYSLDQSQVLLNFFKK
jgi:hypothetical protein